MVHAALRTSSVLQVLPMALENYGCRIAIVVFNDRYGASILILVISTLTE